jgi:hypothetical protein
MRRGARSDSDAAGLALDLDDHGGYDNDVLRRSSGNGTLTEQCDADLLSGG